MYSIAAVARSLMQVAAAMVSRFCSGSVLRHQVFEQADRVQVDMHRAVRDLLLRERSAALPLSGAVGDGFEKCW
ncbi:hypothetical protein ACXX9E_29410 [Pseudomonas sp. GNP014]